MTNPSAGWRVKFDGPCSKCGTVLPAGTVAVWDNRARKMYCLACAPARETSPSPTPIDLAVAGGSARRFHDRLAARRAADLKGKWGERVGGLITRFVAEPQSIRAWGLGAQGEELLGAALDADIVPVLPHARSWVMIEQVAGLLYVALVISRVVGLTISRQRS